jgi:hypothetical protein
MPENAGSSEMIEIEGGDQNVCHCTLRGQQDQALMPCAGIMTPMQQFTKKPVLTMKLASKALRFFSGEIFWRIC